MSRILLLALCAVLAGATSATAQSLSGPQSPPAVGTVTLEAAIQRALDASPTLQGARAAADASKGAQRQAGAFPNPELGLQVENVAGRGSYRGFDSAESTAGLSQLIEIGGKREARQDIADHEHAIAHADTEAARLDLIRDVKTAFADAVAAKEAVALAEKQKSLATEVLDHVAKRVAAAAEPLYQKSKSEVALATSEVALDKARRDYAIARKRLSALWASGENDFTPDSSQFFQTKQPSAPFADTKLAENPTISRLNAEMARSEASYALAQAQAIPDPRISAGIKDFRATKEQALFVGVSIPLPFFDQNRGNIARARGEVTKAASSKRATELELGAELNRSQQELANAYREAETLKSRIIPSAERAYGLSRQGYGAGKFPYLEVLDAQRTLVDARVQYNEALRNYHARAAEVERLTAVYRPQPDLKDDAHAD